MVLYKLKVSAIVAAVPNPKPIRRCQVLKGKYTKGNDPQISLFGEPCRGLYEIIAEKIHGTSLLSAHAGRNCHGRSDGSDDRIRSHVRATSALVLDWIFHAPGSVVDFGGDARVSKKDDDAISFGECHLPRTLAGTTSSKTSPEDSSRFSHGNPHVPSEKLHDHVLVIVTKVARDASRKELVVTVSHGTAKTSILVSTVSFNDKVCVRLDRVQRHDYPVPRGEQFDKVALRAVLEHTWLNRDWAQSGPRGDLNSVAFASLGLFGNGELGAGLALGGIDGAWVKR